MFKFLFPAGMATGVGSLPFIDPETALAVIKKSLPHIPHWPQLPQRGRQEHFVFQFLQVLHDTVLLIDSGDHVIFNTDASDWLEKLTRFYGYCMDAQSGDINSLKHFASPKFAAEGLYAFLSKFQQSDFTSERYLKGHIAGPLSVGLNLKNSRGRIAYYEPELREIIVHSLSLNARWQASVLSDLGRPAIIFVDEPAVGVCGSSHYITITREMILKDLNAIFSEIHAENAVAGVHACASVDWSILFEAELEIVNLDAYCFGNSLLCYASDLKNFLERGGIIAWGIVPTSQNAVEENVASLIRRLENLWEKLQCQGISREKLLMQSMITPSCGTGLLSPELCRRIYNLTAQVSDKLMNQIKNDPSLSSLTNLIPSP